ncbi:Arylsulfatase [Planctomycetes bacterium Pan216]|uniref:Arylsulfatase n=1 Tax=Kolteria novifilia TaxID=2527975 RepID=A0A518B8C4_9BACT|nr:Arylsulfatase [Planctomycetes bacterium Pan216]
MRLIGTGAMGVLFVLAGLLLGVRVAFAAPEHPNVIIIFCDDLGYNDIGPFGSTKHRTPNLDRMAKQGRRFTDFYVSSGVCSPSRSSLMTGCYPRRVGLHLNDEGKWVLFPGNKRGLNPEEITIADLLKPLGYATACVGKWHLGDQPEFLPTRQGFDTYFGIPFSNDMGLWKPERGYPPLPLMRQEKVIETEPDQGELTKRYTEEAVRFIGERKDGPFFLYFPHTMPHAPQAASKDFLGKSANGRWGDAVEEIDWSTGVLLDTLEKLDIADRTLVIFTSDNGGAVRWGASNKPLRGGKGGTWEGGHRVPMIAWWPGEIPAGTTCSEMATTMDLLPTIADLTGAMMPSDRIIDGKDIWPLLAGKPGAKTPHEAYFYYYRDQLDAVRSGDWKLFVNRGNKMRAKPMPAELYHLRDDIGETTNVAAKHPDVVAQLKSLLDQCRQDLGDGAREGEGTRKPGHVEDAKTLTSH